MKKICILLLAAIMLLTLAACGHEHDFSAINVVTEASCTEDGLVEYICSCGEKKTETLPATGHNLANGICEVCGEDCTQRLTVGEEVEIPDVGKFHVTGWSSGEAVVKGYLQLLTGVRGDYYIWVNIEYTNLATESIDAFDLMTGGQLIYQDNYKYDGASGSFTRDIAPLQSNDTYLVYAASDVAASNSGDCIATFCIDGNWYSFQLD